MELHAEGRPETERLHFGLGGPGEQLRAFGQGDGVGVPVQHVELFAPHGEVVVALHALDRHHADF